MPASSCTGRKRKNKSSCFHNGQYLSQDCTFPSSFYFLFFFFCKILVFLYYINCDIFISFYCCVIFPSFLFKYLLKHLHLAEDYFLILFSLGWVQFKISFFPLSFISLALFCWFKHIFLLCCSLIKAWEKVKKTQKLHYCIFAFSFSHQQPHSVKREKRYNLFF